LKKGTTCTFGAKKKKLGKEVVEIELLGRRRDKNWGEKGLRTLEQRFGDRNVWKGENASSGDKKAGWTNVTCSPFKDNRRGKQPR